MLTGLKAYYLAASLLLFLFAVYSNKNALYAFGYGVALNIFPLALLPEVSMDIARIAGMPLAYLPTIAAGLALAVRNQARLPQSYSLLLTLAFIYCAYAFFTTVIMGGMTVANIAYWSAWPLNFLIFFSAAAFFSRVDMHTANKVIRVMATILVLGCLTGLARYGLGIAQDANFMPLVNRNGTVVFIVMVFPLLFYTYKEQEKATGKLMFCVGCIFLTLAFTFSRSGIIGAVAFILLYYMRLSLAGLAKSAAVVLLIATIAYSGVADRSLQRLERVVVTSQMLMHGESLDTSMNDYNRVMLLRGAIATAKDNFWFGTGLGLENYQKAFHKVSDYGQASKAHNFYISYFAELGVAGFSLLLLILYLASRKLHPLSSPHKAFKVSFLVMALMMTMNEYILMPEIWFFYGMLAGISRVGGYVFPPLQLHYVQEQSFNRIPNRSPHG